MPWGQIGEVPSFRPTAAIHFCEMLADADGTGVKGDSL